MSSAPVRDDGDVGRAYAWLDRHDASWAVLREDDRDVDLLVRDDAIPALRAVLPRRARGRKIDVYGVEGAHGTAYHGFAHLPVALAERVLARRIRRADGVWVPHPEDALLALAYHLAYHKAAQSGLDWNDPQAGEDTPARRALESALAAAGSHVAPTLRGLHNALVDAGFGITADRLAAYVRHDFRHGRKVWFHGRLMSRLPGELNLFVVREIAKRHARTDDLLVLLRAHYRVLAHKSVPWTVRWRTRGRMRGGKWRRGGMPCLAVAVFDPEPVSTTPEQREVHPHVFNARQFAKQQWRERFVVETGTRPSSNPIHSTDNEAEAIGHLPLFFTGPEQEAILAEVRALRGDGALLIGRDDAAAPT